jgi:NAD(P)-dependent dehydrogenase (short-subunit alcohol dehydrogenase family)
LLFWEEGACVAVVDNNLEAARTAAEQIDSSGQRVLAIGADLANESDAERAVRETVTRFGRLDVLANVAGVRVPPSSIPEATAESWAFIIGVNLLGVAYTSKFAVPEMLKVGAGSIINVSSANAIVGRPKWAQYDATKAAVLALTRDMAHDHADQNIRINSICPGPTLTSYHIRNRAAADKTSLEAAEASMRAAGTFNLLKRHGEPRELAQSILWLASDESSYVTGANFMIDGGLSA